MKLKAGGLIFALLPLAFIVIFFVIPITSLLVLGIGGDVKEILSASRTRNVVGQTLFQSVSATLLSIGLGVPAAFTLYRLKFKFRKAFRAALTVPFVLPTVVVSAAFLALYNEPGIWVLILALTFFNVTVVMRIVGGYWEDLDDRQTESARMLGASPAYAFVTITLPSLWRSIASAGVLVFLFCATSFGVVFILGGKQFANIETEIYRSTMQFFDLQTAAILSILQIIIVLLTLFVSAKIDKSRGQTVTATPKVFRFKFREHWLTVVVFGLTVIFLHILPLGALLARSLRDSDGSWTLANYQMLFQPAGIATVQQSVISAAWLSLKFAFFAAALSLLLGLAVAVVTSREANRPLKVFQRLLDWAAMLPLGVSAVTLGLGLLISMHKPLGFNLDLRTSVVLIPIAQTLIALPLVLRTILPRLKSISQRQKEGALMLGASPTRVLLSIELPLIKSSLIVATGFAFAASLGEFGATAFLVRGSEKTLPVVIAELLTHPDPSSFGMGLAASVILAMMTASVMVAAESRSV